MSKIINERQHIENAYTNVGLVMNSAGDWDTLIRYIDSYATGLKKELNRDVSVSDALFSYHENIHLPLMKELDNIIVRMVFRKKSVTDLYLEILPHWFDLLKDNKDITAEEAIVDYTAKIKKNRFVNFMMGSSVNGEVRRERKAA